MISGGLEAVITSIDPKLLPDRFAGREYNKFLLEEMPDTVDPCGENGEFHTFAFAGPMFKEKISIKVGDMVRRDGFVFSDVVFNGFKKSK